MLYVDDSRVDPQVRASWLEDLEDLGFQYGDNLDVLTIHFDSDFSQFMTADILAGYETMLYSTGTAFSSMGHEGPSVVDDWLDLGQKKLLMAGENLNSQMAHSIEGANLGLRLGIVEHTSNSPKPPEIMS